MALLTETFLQQCASLIHSCLPQLDLGKASLGGLQHPSPALPFPSFPTPPHEAHFKTL